MRNGTVWAPWIVGVGTLLQGAALTGGLGVGFGLALGGALLAGLLTLRLRSPRSRSALLTLSLGGLGMAWGESLSSPAMGVGLMVLFCLPGCCSTAASCVSPIARWICGAGCVTGMVSGMALAGWLFTAAGGTASCHSGGLEAAASHFAMLLGMSAGSLVGGEWVPWFLRLVSVHLNWRPNRPSHTEVSTPWLT